MEKISISILNANLINIESELNILKEMGIKRIHLDIIDTGFANNISFGPSFINQIIEYDFIFDLHFMIKNPLKILKAIKLNNRINFIIFHMEIFSENNNNLPELYEYLLQKRIKIGIAINPETDAISLFEFLDTNRILVHSVLIMTVTPGFGGQKCQIKCVEKEKLIRKRIDGIKIGVDGGVTLEVIPNLSKCDYFIIGNAFFNEKKLEDKKQFIKEVLSELDCK
ncbi:Ribulose-phosphate 3-epimerase [Astathelohania contejeani]|uniref:Ribulose-phosphate 3-epimerase n=1 Tax=Astathelohania contejeani TaxID=164912 RepID=A0ABQ7HYE6_9MICR|nr:Ribulose-phosphate 3-epimerase [Thelohania contejeani]